MTLHSGGAANWAVTIRSPRTSWLTPARVRLAMAALILFAFFLRVYRLDHQELRGDEAFGYFFLQRNFSGMVEATIDLKEPHPVGSYYVLKSWLAVAGDSEFALRFASVWFSVLAVALTGRLAQRLGFRRIPVLVATALMAVSPYVIWHAQDARMYSMSLALTTAAVWLGVEAMQRQRAAWGLAYAGVAWLALHTHYYAGFVLAALNIFVLSRALFVPRMRANLQAWLLWQMVVVGLYLPWLAGAATIVGGYAGNGDSPDFWSMVQRSLSVFAVGESTPVDQRTVWAAGAGALLLIGGARLLLGNATDRRNLWLLICYLLVPLLAIWWSAQARPIFNERYLVAGAPPFALLIAAAFDGRRFDGRKEHVLRWLTWALLVLLFGGMSLALARHYADPAYSKTRGWRDLAAALERLSAGMTPEEVRIAQNFPDPTIWYYYRGPVEHMVLPPAPHDEAGARAQLDALVAQGVRRVILPEQPAPNWDDRRIAMAALSDSPYDAVLEEQIGVWPVHVFAGGGPVNAEKVLDGAFENGMRLVGVSAIELTPPGGLLTPTLLVDAPATTAQIDALKMTVQLLDGAGTLVAQQDLPLADWRQVTDSTRVRTFGLALPEELEPGVYRLIAGLYDGSVEGLPRVRTLAGDDVVELATVEIARSVLP
jgi:4-amino-4-deoxy-L-arabinose transferase-like glycosyltransferase